VIARKVEALLLMIGLFVADPAAAVRYFLDASPDTKINPPIEVISTSETVIM
jgi:hypothetical protein